jgi:hypothetical protein
MWLLELIITIPIIMILGSILWVVLGIVYCVLFVKSDCKTASMGALFNIKKPEFKGTDQGPYLFKDSIDAAIFRTEFKNELREKSLEFKPTIYSKADQKYMPK